MEAMWVVIEIVPLGPRVQPLKPHFNSPHKTFSFTRISFRGKNLLSEAIELTMYINKVKMLSIYLAL